MGILSFLFGNGLPGAISKDLIKKYIGFKESFPAESDEELTKKVWDLWLFLNKDVIQSGKDIHKAVRLKIKLDKKEASYAEFLPKGLYSLYQDILYIESEVSSGDGSTYREAMKVFIEESKKHDLHFENEYLHECNVLDYLNR